MASKSNKTVVGAIKVALTFATFESHDVRNELSSLLDELESVHSTIELEQNEDALVEIKDQLVATCVEVLTGKSDEDEEKEVRLVIKDDDEDEIPRFGIKNEDDS